MKIHSNLVDYIHLDDHKHNRLTAEFLRDWYLYCCQPPPLKKVWFAQLNIISLRHYTPEENTMPTRSKTKKPDANTQGDWRGFVNVELTDEEWSQIDTAVADKKVNESIPGHLDYLLELGKVTFNYSNNSVSCALTILEGVSKGLTVSSFSDNLVEALLTTRLKVQNYLPDFETLFTGGGGRKTRRG